MARARIAGWLSATTPARFSAFAVAAAFSAYFCMYAFRKPFAAAAWSDQNVSGVDLKIALVISQVVGYALSKFASVKFLSELPPARRVAALFLAIGVAEVALLGVGALPPGGKLVAIFLNGLPLGAVWGLVFGFLEGRRTSEILGAGLSISYIVASGAVKTVGRWVLAAGVPEAWMPAAVGALFLPAFAAAVWLLSCLPPPNAEDERERAERTPMDAAARTAFFLRHAFGLGALTVLYVLLTAYRDFRDNFAFEIWSALGYGEVPAVLTYAELPIAFVVLVSLALVVRVRDNHRAFFVVHALMLAGAALIGIATVLFAAGALDGAAWMVFVGAGLYLAYVPYGCVLFDRLMAMTRMAGTAVFMIYVTDAAGYAGSVVLLLVKHLGAPDIDWLRFFVHLSYVTSAVGVVGFVASWGYFARRSAR